MTTAELITTAADDAPLTIDESADLERHEATIASGLQTFIEVGEALAEIKTSRLYRTTHGTWEDYITQRWPQIGGRRQADRLIGAAEVAADLEESGPIGPLLTGESQIRPLYGLEPEERRQAMQQATAAANGAPPTASQVRQAAEQIRPPAPRPAARPAPPDDGEEEIAAAPARPAPAAPPLLTPMAAAPAPPLLLTPLTPVAPAAPDLAQRKLLAAKYELLDQALLIVDAEIRRLGDGPTIVVRADAAIAAARLFVDSQALNGAASMLSFSTTVEDTPPTLSEVAGDPLAASMAAALEAEFGIPVEVVEQPSPFEQIERRIEGVHQDLDNGKLYPAMSILLRSCRRDLDALADDPAIDTEAYDALSERIGEAQARLAESESEVTG